MKYELKIPITPNFILGNIGSNEIKLAIHEVDEDDLKEIIEKWTAEVWEKHKRKAPEATKWDSLSYNEKEDLRKKRPELWKKLYREKFGAD